MPTYPNGSRQWAEAQLESAHNELYRLTQKHSIGWKCFDFSEVVFTPCGDSCSRLDNYHTECKPGGYLCPAILDRTDAALFRLQRDLYYEMEKGLEAGRFPEADRIDYSREELEARGQGTLL